MESDEELKENNADAGASSIKSRKSDLLRYKKIFVISFTILLLLLGIVSVGLLFLGNQYDEYRSRYPTGESELEESLYDTVAKNNLLLSSPFIDKVPYVPGYIYLNLGIVHIDLADIRDKKSNLQKATDAFNEASMLFNEEEFPKEYAMSHAMLGISYSLQDEERGEVNLTENALFSYKEALKYNASLPPDVVGAILKGVGDSYTTLSNTKERQTNIENAIIAYEGSLNYFNNYLNKKERGQIQFKLANRYYTLSKLNDSDAESLKKAISAYKESRKYYNIKEFPEDYINIQIRIGSAYKELAEIEDFDTNIADAIKSYNEALTAYDFYKSSTRSWGELEIALGRIYLELSEVKESETNLYTAIRILESSIALTEDLTEEDRREAKYLLDKAKNRLTEELWLKEIQNYTFPKTNGKLKTDGVRLVEEVRQECSYDSRSLPYYYPGDTAIFWISAFNVVHTKKVNITFIGEIIYQNGTRIDYWEYPVYDEGVYYTDHCHWSGLDISSDNFKGNYTVRIAVFDFIDGDSVTKEANFTIMRHE